MASLALVMGRFLLCPETEAGGMDINKGAHSEGYVWKTKQSGSAGGDLEWRGRCGGVIG